MISFFISLAILVVGFIFYGKFTDRIFAPDDRKTPAVTHNDGVDCVPMKTWKAVLVELLNIAGTGPIFGALMGACFGPIVFLWIIAGSILGGAVHDYMCGMISERHGGESIAMLSGIYLGRPVKYIMRIFSIVLLVLVGTVFVTSPAALIAKLTTGPDTKVIWIGVILAYFVLATLLPVDKVIGRLYPIFGVLLIIMALCIVGGIIFSPQYSMPEIRFENLHPNNLPVWPFMFVTVACGAISGFHSTQAPIVSKCIMSEKAGRRVFYGAMIIEAVIALIWAAAGVAFYSGTEMLTKAISDLGQSGVVYEISQKLLGPFGGILAVVGVVICPITSGDTAFRSARLILAEWTGLDQKKIRNRLILTIPMIAVSALLTQINFDVLWRYFSWSNQTLAALVLWVATSYLIHKGKYRFGSLITALPAAFMSAVSVTYILMAQEGFRLSARVGYPVGIFFAILLLMAYALQLSKWKHTDPEVKANWTEVASRKKRRENQ